MLIKHPWLRSAWRVFMHRLARTPADASTHHHTSHPLLPLRRCPMPTAGCSVTAARSGVSCLLRTGRRCRRTRGKSGTGEAGCRLGCLGTHSGCCCRSPALSRRAVSLAADWCCPWANCCPSRRLLAPALSPHPAPCPSMCCSEYAVWDVTKQLPHKPACKKAAGKKAAGKKAAGGGSGGGRRGGRK